MKRYSENPTITAARGKAKVGAVPAREFAEATKAGLLEALGENVITYGLGAGASFFGYADNAQMLLLFDTPENRETAAERIRKGEIAPVFPLRKPIGGQGTIPMFWSAIRRDKVVGLIGAAMGNVYEGDLVLTHMAVKEKYRRNRINWLMVSFFVEMTKVKRVVFDDLTTQGRAFMQSFGGIEWWQRGKP